MAPRSRGAPPVVLGLTGVVELALGDEHTCALVEDGSVRCWGDGSRGQLGHREALVRAAPVSVHF